jgi:MFS family permease
MYKVSYKKNLVLFFALRFFTSLTLGLYFAFGSLLVYNKTHSIILTLIYNLVNYLGLVLLNSVLLPVTLKAVNFFGPKRCMAAGLVVLSLSYLMLFQIQASATYFAFILLLIALLNSLGSNLYYILSNTTYYLVIGNSDRPGMLSALLSTNSTVAGIIAAIVGLLFNQWQIVGYIFLAQGLLLIIGVAALMLMDLPQPVYEIKFPHYLKKLSLYEHLAAMELNHELATTAVPLIVLLKFNSLDKSFLVNSLVLLGTIVAVNLAGYLKDKNNNMFLYIASGIGVVGWIMYLFADTPGSFIILGILVGVSYKAIGTAFDGRLGRKFSNSGAGLEMQLSFNFSQILGRVFIIIGLLLTYLISGSIDTLFLITGSLLIIPKIIFAFKNIDQRDSLIVSQQKKELLS